LLRHDLSPCLGFLSLEWVESPSNPSRHIFRSFVRVVSRDKPSNNGVSGQVYYARHVKAVIITYTHTFNMAREIHGHVAKKSLDHPPRLNS
jgi:hypothetical protein